MTIDPIITLMGLQWFYSIPMQMMILDDHLSRTCFIESNLWPSSGNSWWSMVGPHPETWRTVFHLSIHRQHAPWSEKITLRWGGKIGKVSIAWCRPLPTGATRREWSAIVVNDNPIPPFPSIRYQAPVSLLKWFTLLNSPTRNNSTLESIKQLPSCSLIILDDSKIGRPSYNLHIPSSYLR